MDQATALAAGASQGAQEQAKVLAKAVTPKTSRRRISRNLTELFAPKTLSPLALKSGKNRYSWQSLMPSQPEPRETYSMDFGFVPDQNPGVLGNKVSVWGQS